MADAPLGPNESGIARTLVRPFGRLIGHTASEGYDPGTGGTGEPAYDTDAAAYFTAVEAAGGSFDLTATDATYTETYVKEAHNNFYAGLKNDGLWDKLTEFYLLTGKTFDGITVKAKGTGSLTNNNFVSGDYLPAGTGAGLVGNRSTKYLNTGLSVSSVDNKSLSYYASVAPTNGISMAIIAADNGSLNYGLSLGRVYGGSYDAFNACSVTSDRVLNSATASAGHFLGSSRSLSDRELYKNETSVAANTTVSADMTGVEVLTIFAIDSPALYSDATLTFAHIGTGLTDTDAANLSSRVNTLMTALGCNVY